MADETGDWSRFRAARAGSGASHEGPSSTAAGGALGQGGRSASPLDAARRVLGVQPGSGADELTAAYRRMAQMYHPDKVAGLGPEFSALAEQKMKEINAAYDLLRRSA